MTAGCCYSKRQTGPYTRLFKRATRIAANLSELSRMLHNPIEDLEVLLRAKRLGTSYLKVIVYEENAISNYILGITGVPIVKLLLFVPYNLF